MRTKKHNKNVLDYTEPHSWKVMRQNRAWKSQMKKPCSWGREQLVKRNCKSLLLWGRKKAIPRAGQRDVNRRTWEWIPYFHLLRSQSFLKSGISFNSRKSPIKFLSQDVRDLFSMYIPTIRCLLPEFIWVTTDQNSSWVQVPFQRPSSLNELRIDSHRKRVLMGWLCSPKRCIDVLTPETYASDLIWK